MNFQLSLSALKGPFIFVLSQVCSVRLGIMCEKLALTFAVPYQKGQDVPPPLPSPPRRECSRDKHVYAFAGCSENTQIRNPVLHHTKRAFELLTGNKELSG